MPFKSIAQEKYFMANRAKLERQGVDVGEWARASRGLNLPQRAKKKKAEEKSVFKRIKNKL